MVEVPAAVPGLVGWPLIRHVPQHTWLVDPNAMREEISCLDARESFSWQFVSFVVDTKLIPVGLQVIKSAGVHTLDYP